jgi:hypothetical protein
MLGSQITQLFSLKGQIYHQEIKCYSPNFPLPLMSWRLGRQTTPITIPRLLLIKAKGVQSYETFFVEEICKFPNFKPQELPAIDPSTPVPTLPDEWLYVQHWVPPHRGPKDLFNTHRDLDIRDGGEIDLSIDQRLGLENYSLRNLIQYLAYPFLEQNNIKAMSLRVSFGSLEPTTTEGILSKILVDAMVPTIQTTPIQLYSSRKLPNS